MSTSGTYNFATPQSEQIITDAYERIGILPDVIVGQKIFTAQRSINLILNSWLNRGLNLWTVKREMLGLNAGQNTYNLAPNTSDVLEATVRTSVRNLGGTPFSSAGGIAANAFDNNPNTACTQTAANGYISYNWNLVQYAIGMVGIQSNATLTYTLVFEYSNDNATWIQVYAPIAQTYNQGELVWFIIPVPTLGSKFRVRETGGATLDIQELYFNTALNDTVITRISRSEWMAYPNKNQSGRPTSFWVDRQINPIIILWPTPTAQYNNLFYSRIESIQDVGSMQNMPEIPARFLEALTSELSASLSVKFSQELKLDLNFISMLKEYADSKFNEAAREDRERVPLRIYGDYMQGWTQV